LALFPTLVRATANRQRTTDYELALFRDVGRAAPLAKLALFVRTPEGGPGANWLCLTPATKVEKVESEPRFGANIADYSSRLRLLSQASNKANLAGPGR
jgi:hypothetical protein